MSGDQATGEHGVWTQHKGEATGRAWLILEDQRQLPASSFRGACGPALPVPYQWRVFYSFVRASPLRASFLKFLLNVFLLTLSEVTLSLVRDLLFLHRPR